MLGSPREPAKQTLNVTASHYKASASALASSAPELLHQPCTHPARRRRAGKSGCIPALVLPLVSTEPQIPRAQLNSASAGLDGKGEGFCRAAISISGPSLSCFSWCFLKDLGLLCTLSSLKCGSRSLWSPPAQASTPRELQISPPAPVSLQDQEGVSGVTALLWGHQQDVKSSLPWESQGWGRCSPQVKKGTLMGVGNPTCPTGTTASPTSIAQSTPLL